MYSKEDLSNEPVGQEQETVFYLDKPTDTFANKTRAFWKNVLAPAGKVVGGSLSKATSKTVESATLKVKELRQKKQTQLNELPEPPTKENHSQAEPSDRFHREFLKDSPRDDGLLKDEEINYSPEFVHYYKEKNQANP